MLLLLLLLLGSAHRRDKSCSELWIAARLPREGETKIINAALGVVAAGGAAGGLEVRGRVGAAAMPPLSRPWRWPGVSVQVLASPLAAIAIAIISRMPAPRWLVSAAPRLRLLPSRAYSSSAAGPQPERVHVPVLLQETLRFWRPEPEPSEAEPTEAERVFVDGTAGFGGHARALLQLEPRARLLCVDRDPEVLAVARRNLRAAGLEARAVFRLGSYADVRAHLAAAGLPPLVAGALVDLGANSFHLDEPRRGFSFSADGPLDMRFDQRQGGRTAADVVNGESEAALTRIFRELGEERLAKEYAKAIVRERARRGQFRSTLELRDCIERIARKWGLWGGRRRKPGVHPATRCFQALRIHVNDELDHVQVRRQVSDGGVGWARADPRLPSRLASASWST